MLRLLCQLILLAAESAAKLAGLPLSAPERLAWERERIAAFERGEPSAFSDLYRAYAGLIYARIVLPILKQPAAAEDALADAFERAHGKLHEVRIEDRSLFFWLVRIAKNRALDMQRRSIVERLATAKLESEAPLLDALELNAEAELSVRDEEQLLATRIRAVLDQLHPRYGQAVRMRILDERSREDCATTLGVSVATFDVVLLRALRAFRKSWQEPTGT
jgi:RNA polymerase sigma factor (sigma-70 family)